MAGTQIQGLDALMGQQMQLRMNEGQGNRNAGPGSEFEDLMAQAAGVLEAARMANGQEQQGRQTPGASADADITQLGAAKRTVKPAETSQKPKASQENKKNISQEDNKENARVTDDNAKQGKDLQKVADDAGRNILSEVSEKLDIPEAEIEAVMETLGLSAFQLLDPANLTALITELTGESDPMMLVTDAGLYQTYKDLMSFAAEAGIEAGVSPEDVKALEQIQITEELFPAQDGIKADLSGAQSVAAGEEAPVQVKMSQTDADGNSVVVEVTVDNGQVVSEQNISADTDQEPGKHDGRGSREESESASRTRQAPEQVLSEIAGHMVQEQINFNEVLPAAEQVTGTDMQQMVDIVRQITEQIRVNISADVTSMELTLHPASLGNVQLTVAQDAQGRMVAQFAVENETVRQAIESQLGSLQQRLDAQGIRIEAVEVTIASHTFENGANGQQTGEQADRQREEQLRAAGPRGTRRINLDEFDPEEAADEEEKLAAQMMAANGNTVDYTA